MLTKDEAQKLAEKILSYSKFPECEISIDGNEDAFVRFANNGLTTSGLVRQQQISISSTKDRKTGNTSVNQIDDKSLRDAVARSEEMAEIALPNEEHVPSLPPQHYPEIDRLDPTTASARSPELIVHARNVIDAARSKSLVAAGFVQRSARANAIASKTGLFGYSASADSSLTATARTPAGDGSGWASQPAIRFAELDSSGVARRAVEKCLASRGAKRIEPGKYTVVMEPAAVAALVGYFGFALNARAAEEGRSFLSKDGGGTRVGEKMFPDIINLRSDPTIASIPARPWGFDRLPVQAVTWIDAGVVTNLRYDRFWAMQKNRQPSPPEANMILDGQPNAIDDLIAATDRGLLITHFWYIRFVNPKTMQLTGLTRDGLLLIENGKITGPVMNLRFNESPVRLLQNAKMLGRPERVQEDEVSDDLLVPPLQATEFTFSSVSDAV
jgi:predicted Zn-dependent protease